MPQFLYYIYISNLCLLFTLPFLRKNINIKSLKQLICCHHNVVPLNNMKKDYTSTYSVKYKVTGLP